MGSSWTRKRRQALFLAGATAGFGVGSLLCGNHPAVTFSLILVGVMCLKWMDGL